MGKVFNKGLEKEDKKEGLLKTSKNTEDKNEEKWQMIKSKNSKDLRIKSVTNIFDKELSKEAKNIITKRKNPEKKSTRKGLALREIKIWNLILGIICL